MKISVVKFVELDLPEENTVSRMKIIAVIMAVIVASFAAPYGNYKNFLHYTQCIYDSFFFLKFLADTCPFLGPLVPLFWISGDVWVSKPEWVLPYSLFLQRRMLCTFPKIHLWCYTYLLAAGTHPVTSPHACAEVGLGSDSNVQPHEQKTNELPLCQRPGLLYIR